MFSTTGRRSGTLSLTDLDVWENDSCFRSQTSAWSDMSEVCGSGFLPTVSERFRQGDARLPKWKSPYRLPDLGKDLFSPPGTDLMVASARSRFQQAEVMQWLQDAHTHFESVDQLKSKDKDLNFNLSHAKLPDMNRKVESSLSAMSQRLKGAEEKAMVLEKERNKAHQLLNTSNENQKALQTEIKEMNQRISYTLQRHSETQEQLTDANNKLSQACLDKAKLSTQVLKLENHVKELTLKLTEVLSDKKHLIKEKEDLSKRTHDLEKQWKGNENLKKELEILQGSLEKSQHQLQVLKKENIFHQEMRLDLEKKCDQLIRENEELRGRNDKEKLELENVRLRDQCLCLQAEILEKENMVHLQEEKHREQDLENIRTIAELKATTSHWIEKWQNVAQSLQSTQEELEKSSSNSNSEMELGSRQPDELDACKQEQEKSKRQAVVNADEELGREALLIHHRQTQTCLSESSLLGEPSPDQMCVLSGDVQSLRETLNQREKQIRELEHALKNLKVQREKEKAEAWDRISALELKLSPRVQALHDDDGNLNEDNVLINEPLRNQQDNQSKTDWLDMRNTLAAKDLQPPKTLHSVKDEKPSVKDKMDKTPCLATDQHKRMINEQAATDRRNWQALTGLTPVLEEDEESCDSPEELEIEPAGNSDKILPDQRQQVSAEFSSSTTNNGSQKQEIFSPRHTVWEVPSAEAFTCLDYSQKKLIWNPQLYPDGIFTAKIVDICSHDEDDEEDDENDEERKKFK